MEGAGKLEDVVREEIRPEVIEDGGEDLAEADEQAGEVDFRRLGEVDFCGGGVEGRVELAENGADADVGVL